MADDVNVIIGAKIDGLIAAVDQVNQKLGHMQSSAESMSNGFAKLGELIVAAFSVEKITQFVEKMADLGLQTERTMAMLGMSADEVVRLGGMAALTGTSMESLTMGVERMSLNIQRSTRDAFSPQAQALQVLGLRAKDLIGLPAAEYFDKLREAVSRFNPSLNLTNAVMAVGSRGIAQMMPLLTLAGTTYKEFEAQVAKAREGLAAAVPGMAQTHINLTLLGLSAQSLGARIFTVLKPAIDLVVTSLTNWMQKLDSKTIQDFARALVDILGRAVISVIGLFLEFGHTLDDIMSKLKVVLTGAAIGGAAGILGGPGGALLGALSGGALALVFSDWLNSFDRGASKAKADIEQQKADLVARVTAMMKAINDAIAAGGHGASPSAGGGQNAGAINEGARNAVEAQKARYEAEIALLQQNLSRRKILYDLDAGLWKTTDDTKFASTMAASAAEFAAEEAKLTKIRDLWKVGTKEWEAEETKRVAATAKHGTEMVNLNAQSLLSMKTKWDEVFGAMQSSFNSQLRGLLAGTMTWGQAFKSVIGDMVIFFIQAIEKMVFQWLAGQAAQLFATQSTAGAKAASEVAANEATLPVRVAAFTSNLTAQAALVFAGIFANLAPFLGPAAAGPAAAGQAVTLAQLANVPKFDVGTNYVMSTGIAMIHAGEKITPAQGSGPYDASKDKAGGDTHNWYLIDGAGVQDFVTRNAGALAAATANYQRRNPSTRPRW